MLRKTLFLLLISCSLVGQVFVPLGDSLYSPSLNSTSNDSNYCFHVSVQSGAVGYTIDEFFISGPSGSVYTNFPSLSWGTPEVLEFINGELYVVSNIKTWSANDKAMLSKYSNGNWVLLDSIPGRINTGLIFQGQMYYGGYIQDSVRQLRNIVRLVNGNFSQVASFSTRDSIYSLHTQGGELWAAGRFNLSSNTDTAHILVFNPSANSWTMPIKENPNFSLDGRYFKKGFSYANENYFIRDSSVYKVKNDSLHLEYQFSIESWYHLWFKIKAFELYGKLYFNAGSHIIEYDGISYKRIDPNLGGNIIGTIHPYQNKIHGSVVSSFPSIGGVLYNYSFLFDPLSLSIHGTLNSSTYLDEDLNCQLDSSELIGISANVLLQNPQMGTQFMVGFHENVSLYIPAGLYQVDTVRTTRDLHKNLVWNSTCLSDTFRVDTNGISTVFDFPFKHNGVTDYAVSIDVVAGRLRQGFKESALLRVQNLSGQDANAPWLVQVVLPSPVSYVSSSSQTPPQISGDTLFFSIQGLQSLREKQIMITLDVPVETIASDTLCIEARLLAPVDSITANNLDSFCGLVVGAYDPNDKLPSLEQSLPGLSQLDYHIRFQNTGTDTAYKVVVRDTLEAYFDPFSIKLGPSSHSYQFQLEDENILVWTFENILLPDSSTNPLGSQGFLKFQIDLDPSLPVGFVIDNDAEIYFDFQAPIHTNHAQTEIVSVLNLLQHKANNLKAFPNPIQSYLQLEGVKEIREVQLRDLQGRIIMHWSFSEPNSNQTLDFSQVPKGIHVLCVGDQRIKVLKVE